MKEVFSLENDYFCLKARMEKLTMLVIPGYQLFPVGTGGAHYQLTFLDKQQYQFMIDLLVTPDNIREEDMPAFQKRFPHLRLLPAGFAKKGTLAKAASFTRKQLRKWTGRDLSYKLGKSKQLRGFFINDAGLVAQIAALAAAKKYDLIQVEHAKNLGLVSILPAGVKKIFVHHEIFYARVREDMKAQAYPEAFSRYIASFAEEAEIGWLNKYDGWIVLNADDKKLLQAKGVSSPGQVARPFALFDADLQHVHDADASPVLVFAGGEAHYPNKEGLEWFLGQVFPLVKEQVAHAVVLITGNWSEAFRQQYAAEPSIRFTGFIEDMDEVYRNGIMVVPIRIGSGIRVKLFTAMAKGMPAVSTVLGASGIPGLKDGENILLAEEATAFAAAAASLLENKEKRKTLSDNTFALAKGNFDNAAFVSERNDFYATVLEQ